VAYRDHPPQDNSYVTKVYDFTDQFPQMKKNVVRYRSVKATTQRRTIY
jgi:uncharacterized protein Usg